MSSVSNMLLGVVRDENTHTKLLYNLMQLDEFRGPVLTLLFKSDICALAAHWDMKTQAKLDDNCGCADLVIDRDPDVCAILEVKLLQSCGLTENQPDAYIRFLSRKRRTERLLTFLVPRRWAHRDRLHSLFNNSKDRSVTTRIVEWEELMDLLESKQLRNPILTEFRNLLVGRYKTKPVNFSHGEVEMLFSEETAAAVSKLYELIDKIRDKSDGYNQTGQRSDPHGIYFHDSQNEEIFWIGNWPEFWRGTGNPLAFGVSRSCSPSVRAAFTKSYNGNKTDFKDENGGCYTVGWISEEDLSATDALEKVWSQIAPILEAVSKAGGPVEQTRSAAT
jgi:hypothetical protein